MVIINHFEFNGMTLIQGCTHTNSNEFSKYSEEYIIDKNNCGIQNHTRLETQSENLRIETEK